jgi:predicted PurR-regulated permease PerM
MSEAESRPTRAPAPSGLKRFRAGWLALLAAIVIALFLCWVMVRPLADVLLWAAVLVIVFYPFHQALLRRSNRPTTSAMLSCVLVVGIIVLPLTLLTVVIVKEAGDATEYLSNNWSRLVSPESPHMKRVTAIVGPERMTKLASKDGLRDALQDALQAIGVPLAAGAGVVVGSILTVAVKILFVVLTMFYLFRDGERVVETLRNTLPLDRVQSAHIFARTREVINASVHGNMVIAIIQGIMGGLGFWWIGLPSPVLWGSVMILLSMIPVIGSTIVWVPTAGWLAINGHPFKALFLVVWGGGVIASIDYFLRPRLVGGRTRLHELLIFFSVVGGLQAFGILGIVIGPVLVAITLALLDVFRKADRPTGAAFSSETLVEAQARLRDVPPEGDREPADAGTPAGVS